MTRYVILVQDKTANGLWLELCYEEAHSPAGAVVRAYLKNPDANTVAMVAVPARSWKPTPIRTETKTRVVLGEVAKQGKETP